VVRGLEHPDITSTLRTGYPLGNQPKSHYCEECGKCLDCEEIYADSIHEYLCKDCLLMLHERRVWW
jgi:hypothetical protein